MEKYFAITSKDKSVKVYKEENDIKSIFSFGKEKWEMFSDIEKVTVPGDIIEEIDLLKAKKILEKQRYVLDNLLTLSAFISKMAHEGQYDRGGHPYFLHPKTVADSLEDTEQKIIAYLHDICEDTSLTLSNLEEMYFTAPIVYAVSLLTKGKNTPYMKYLEDVKKNKNATEVKKSDLKHNMDLSRIPHPTEKDFRRVEKYKKALAFLEE